jgi:hypothetical protein
MRVWLKNIISEINILSVISRGFGTCVSSVMRWPAPGEYSDRWRKIVKGGIQLQNMTYEVYGLSAQSALIWPVEMPHVDLAQTRRPSHPAGESTG